LKNTKISIKDIKINLKTSKKELLSVCSYMDVVFLKMTAEVLPN
jgi:hypothetical protein